MGQNLGVAAIAPEHDIAAARFGKMNGLSAPAMAIWSSLDLASTGGRLLR
jgi:hypothetical protein